MSNPNGCRSCYVQENQVRVESNLFVSVGADGVKERLKRWPGVLHVCKVVEGKWAYVHFKSPEAASVSFHTRNPHTDRGEPVSVSATYKNGVRVVYAQTALNFGPARAPPPATTPPATTPPTPTHTTTTTTTTGGTTTTIITTGGTTTTTTTTTGGTTTTIITTGGTTTTTTTTTTEGTTTTTTTTTDSPPSL
ncbi:uncharacterized protein EV154DRAFT_102204 [Mucor mucedo]|uniref:uncharacterized protein n=1 Tax=Mucor mucedo TaxID=29922 RepID=UPI002220D946|nr:uncharacterized protein EV154DRAFT_102204 [Mucor mucedo]KAI7873168.1 hypothetical protein EV154DRAFT_102204 [Mucor mucedo]